MAHAGREADEKDIRWLRRLDGQKMSEVGDIQRLVSSDSDTPRRALARGGRVVGKVRDEHLRWSWRRDRPGALWMARHGCHLDRDSQSDLVAEYGGEFQSHRLRLTV